MKKFVVCGYKESGKTTLINKVIAAYQGTVCGFYTRKFPDRLTEEGLCPIYIYPVGSSPIFTDDYLIGLGGEGTHYTNTEVFDRVGIDLISTSDPNTLIVMDEVGFLEGEAKAFQEKVFSVLSGPNPVVLIMKQKMRESFMQSLKDFPGIEYIELSEENRDLVAEKIIEALR